MRILHVSRRYAPEVIGGYERNCQRFAEEWSRRGHEVAVLTREAPGAPELQGVRVHRTLPDMAPSRGASPLRNRLEQIQVGLANRRCAAVTGDVLRRWTPDVVVFWGMNSWLVAPVVAAWQARVPCVFDLGDYWLAEALAAFACASAPKRFYRQRVMLGAAFDASRVETAIVHSEFMQRYYVARGLAPQALHVIPRGFDLTPGVPQRRQAESIVRIACVGRVVPDKGAVVLARAFAALQKQAPNVQLDFYGEAWPEYLQELEAESRAHGLWNTKVFAHGHVAPAQMDEVYAHTDILAFPVLWDEPSSNVLLEAMGAGIPVVATRTGSTPEFIIHASNGLLVERGDADATAQALLQLVRDPALRRAQGEAGRRRALARHRLADVFDQTEALLETVASRRPSPREGHQARAVTG